MVYFPARVSTGVQTVHSVRAHHRSQRLSARVPRRSLQHQRFGGLSRRLLSHKLANNYSFVRWSFVYWFVLIIMCYFCVDTVHDDDDKDDDDDDDGDSNVIIIINTFLKRWVPELASYMRLKALYMFDLKTGGKKRKEKKQTKSQRHQEKGGNWRVTRQVPSIKYTTSYTLHYSLSPTLSLSLSLSLSIPLFPLPPLSPSLLLSLPLPFTDRPATRTTAVHEHKTNKNKSLSRGSR